MAKKSTTTKSLDSDVARELEQALDIDLNSETGGDLDIAASMEDLEAQISQAAEELARAGRSGNARAAANEPSASPAASAPSSRQQELRPVEPKSNGADERAPQPTPVSPANDDRQKDYRSLLHSLNRRASNTVYWIVALVSIAWIAAPPHLPT